MSTPHAHPRTLTEAFLRNSELHADRPAVVRRDGPPLSWRELRERALSLAGVLTGLRRADEPLHVGILADNVEEWPEIALGTFLAGGAVVGLNTTRHGADLGRDVTHADCSVVFAQDHQVRETGLPDTGVPVIRLGPRYESALDGAEPVDAVARTEPGDTAFLLFTSGSTSAPKAVIRSHGTAVSSGRKMAERLHLGPGDVGYISMPLFHGAAVMTVFVPALLTGAAVALRERFSVSGFLPDVRRLGVTWWGYTGKPLAYLLSSTEEPDDADNPLRCAVGNEGNTRNCDAFARRFGCDVIDFYGSTEGGVGMVRMTSDPPGALGRAPEGVKILATDGTECPVAEFDAQGRMLNADVAIGEIVNTAGTQVFEGYWKNPEATEQRSKGGAYHSGDLGWRNADGYLYFAGRSDDWVRVDGENFATAAVERLLEDHPDVVTAAVVAVPDEAAGDQLLAVVEARTGATTDAAELVAWMSAHPDCGTKWLPRYVRFVGSMPLAGSHKVDRRRLRREGVQVDGVLERGGSGYVPVDVAALRARLASSGREHLLDI